MTVRSFQRLSILLIGLLSTAGCHTFQATSFDALTPGQTVRARVSGVWADSLDAVLMRDARVFEADVIEERGASALFEIAVATSAGVVPGRLNQRVELPASAFVDLELKTLDRRRTALAASAVGIAVGAAIYAQLSGRSGGKPDFGGPGPVEARVSPLLRLVWP